MDMERMRRLAAETAHYIFTDLADRRGVPRDLAYGNDWKGARERAARVVLGAIMATDVGAKGEK